MVAPRPENPEADIDDVKYPETVPDPVEDADELKPGTELLPEKGDVHQGNASE